MKNVILLLLVVTIFIGNWNTTLAATVGVAGLFIIAISFLLYDTYNRTKIVYNTKYEEKLVFSRNGRAVKVQKTYYIPKEGLTYGIGVHDGRQYKFYFNEVEQVWVED